MALCLTDNVVGGLAIQSPQPTDLTTCSLVALTGVEATQYAPHSWTLEEANNFLGAAALVLGTALLFRWAIQFIRR